jgi:hypothetical protein
VEVADVGRTAGDALAVEFEDQAERGVGGGVLGAEVQDPAVAGVHVTGEVLGGFDINIKAFFGSEREGHVGPPGGTREGV